jgi:protease II
LRSDKIWKYIRSYSPYDNLADAYLHNVREISQSSVETKCPPHASQYFPHLLLTSSLHDPRVPYHEPAKYVALLRFLTATSGSFSKESIHSKDPVFLLLTAMSGGHGSASGASNRLLERAQKIGFLLWALNVKSGCVQDN